WQEAYSQIDFSARLAWWRQRWRSELVPEATITVAERDGALVGFVTVDPRSLYLDQIVVAPEAWGSDVAESLIKEAMRLWPSGAGLHVNTDNGRAIRFYEKHNFKIAGQGVNPISGRPVYTMAWRP